MTERATAAGDQEASPATGVRPRILVPLFISLSLMIATFCALLVRDIRHHRADEIARTTSLADDIIRSELERGTQVMASVAALLLANQELAAEFRRRDRAALLRLSEPIFQQVERENRISHLYYHVPDGTNLLRVHHPEEYGDSIERFTLNEARRTGKPAMGNEQGPFGTCTLRFVAPWLHAGELLGYLELGIELEDVMQRVHDLIDGNVLVTMDKQLLDRDKWGATNVNMAATCAGTSFLRSWSSAEPNESRPRSAATFASSNPTRRRRPSRSTTLRVCTGRSRGH